MYCPLYAVPRLYGLAIWYSAPLCSQLGYALSHQHSETDTTEASPQAARQNVTTLDVWSSLVFSSPGRNQELISLTWCCAAMVEGGREEALLLVDCALDKSRGTCEPLNPMSISIPMTQH